MTKELSELTLEELWDLFPIILETHNEKYSEWYAEMKSSLMACLNASDYVRLNHIGSTAVKGLLSKPTVDILLEIDEESNIDDIADKLIEDGWILMQSVKTPDLNYVFNKGYTKFGFAEKVYHLHVKRFGDWDELYFRDYLIDHEKVSIEYAKLKSELLVLYRNDRDGYTDAKSDFVKTKSAEARAIYGDRYGYHKKE